MNIRKHCNHCTKPILFIQCPKNEDGDNVFSYLNSIPDMKNKILLIHTDSTGEITKTDLPKAREFAKTIDDPDPKKNPYEAIVSTMMLNEGWDVRNVNVIVGLDLIHLNGKCWGVKGEV